MKSTCDIQTILKLFFSVAIYIVYHKTLGGKLILDTLSLKGKNVNYFKYEKLGNIS